MTEEGWAQGTQIGPENTAAGGSSGRAQSDVSKGNPVKWSRSLHLDKGTGNAQEPELIEDFAFPSGPDLSTMG